MASTSGLVGTTCFPRAEQCRKDGGGGVSKVLGGATPTFFPSTATAGLQSVSASYCLISLTVALSAAAAVACALSYVFLRVSGEGSVARLSDPAEGALEPVLSVSVHTAQHRE